MVVVVYISACYNKNCYGIRIIHNVMQGCRVYKTCSDKSMQGYITTLQHIIIMTVIINLAASWLPGRAAMHVTPKIQK